MAKKELVALIERGYFPEELPPPFTTKSFSDLINHNLTDYRTKVDHKIGNKWTNYCRHNLARNGRIKRVLAICHPKHFFRLADEIQKNWVAIDTEIRKSKITKTAPIWGKSNQRAIIRESSLDDRPHSRAEICLKARYLLKTDIERFFPSIYTHSIPWALHGKATAKARIHMRGRKGILLGEKLDQIVRGSQSGQTIGIPIGPDTSRVLSEILLAAVDNSLRKKFITDAFHFVDDYEFAFNSIESANECFTSFYESLAIYELSPNLRKTNTLKLPYSHENVWLNELRAFQLDAVTGKKTQYYKLQSYFDLVVEYSKKYPEDSVMKWAMAKLAGIKFIHKENWKFVVNNLCNLIVNDPSSIDYAINFIKRMIDAGYPAYRSSITKTFNEIIRNESSLRHANYVSWAIWSCLVLNLKISNANVKRLGEMEDVIVALLTLHAKKLGLLVGKPYRFENWRPLMVQEELNGDKWLLSYEAKNKSWLPSFGITDHIKGNILFSYLRKNNVSFYDESTVLAWQKKMQEKPILPATIEPLASVL